jgi:hypothetical protein
MNFVVRGNITTTVRMPVCLVMKTKVKFHKIVLSILLGCINTQTMYHI